MRNDPTWEPSLPDSPAGGRGLPAFPVRFLVPTIACCRLTRYNNAFAAAQHEHGVFRPRRTTHSEGLNEMAEGTIKRLTDKGFGFIDTGTEKDLFFHHSSLEGVSYEELKEGQRVTFTEGSGPKGPRAENVKLA